MNTWLHSYAIVVVEYRRDDSGALNLAAALRESLDGDSSDTEKSKVPSQVFLSTQDESLEGGRIGLDCLERILREATVVIPVFTSDPTGTSEGRDFKDDRNELIKNIFSDNSFNQPCPLMLPIASKGGKFPQACVWLNGRIYGYIDDSDDASFDELVQEILQHFEQEKARKLEEAKNLDLNYYDQLACHHLGDARGFFKGEEGEEDGNCSHFTAAGGSSASSGNGGGDGGNRGDDGGSCSGPRCLMAPALRSLVSSLSAHENSARRVYVSNRLLDLAHALEELEAATSKQKQERVFRRNKFLLIHGILVALLSEFEPIRVHPAAGARMKMPAAYGLRGYLLAHSKSEETDRKCGGFAAAVDKFAMRPEKDTPEVEEFEDAVADLKYPLIDVTSLLREQRLTPTGNAFIFDLSLNPGDKKWSPQRSSIDKKDPSRVPSQLEQYPKNVRDEIRLARRGGL